MRRRTTPAERRALTIALVIASVPLRGLAAGGRDYPVKPVPFTAVHFEDAFWAPRIETNRVVTVPFALKQCEDSKRVYHFERAAAVLRGQPLEDKKPPGYPFDDTDLYKVIEGAAYTLSVHRDPKLEAYLDELIAVSRRERSDQELPPITRRLYGILRGAKFDREDYIDYLVRKYR